MPDDRYDVNPLDGPAQFANWRRSIEGRVGALEGAPMVGVSLESKDTDGSALVVVGPLADGSRGLQVISEETGYELLRATSQGWAAER